MHSNASFHQTIRRRNQANDCEFELTGVKPGGVRVLAFHREFASGNSGVLTLAEGTPQPQA